MPRHPPLRWLPLLLMCGAAALPGCGLKNILPANAVLDAAELAAWPAPVAAVQAPEGPAKVDFPVIPLQAFGFFYDLDLVVVSKHPDWDMHEYARIQTPDGPMWLAKDANNRLEQTIATDLPDPKAAVAEVPVHRVKSRIDVQDLSEGRNVDVSLGYTNAAGDAVQVSVKGKVPKHPPGKRNGNTMGHSADAAQVVLDLQRMGGAGKTRIEIGGQRYGIRRILGILPYKFILQQCQAGFAVTSFRQAPAEGGFTLVRPAGGDEVDPATGEPGWPTARTEEWQVSEGAASYDSGLTRMRYDFIDGGLGHAEVRQMERELPTLEAWFDPALPDLGRPFAGEAESRFRLDVNGQAGHGEGVIRARWVDESTVSIEILPTAPRWLANRPLAGTLHFPGDGSVVTQIVRVRADP